MKTFTELQASDIRRCWKILETSRDKNGYIPCLVFEGVSGCFPASGRDGGAPWYWGKTREEAEQVCANANQRQFGITSEQAEDIYQSSIAASFRQSSVREDEESSPRI